MKSSLMTPKTMPTTMTRTATMTRVSQLWDLIETWGFREDIKDIVANDVDDNDDNNNNNNNNEDKDGNNDKGISALGLPQGATIGILEYLSQSNNNTDFIDINDKFKFVDDLTVLETINLISVGLTSYNTKNHIPSDISIDNSFIPPQNLKSQNWMNEINSWTLNQKMQLNKNKTKNMFFNFTKNYQPTTRLQIENENIEVLDSTKLLGTVISNDLKWELNTKNIVKKANARMQILRKASQFGASVEDLKLIYFLYIRSQLEQSATVWHSTLILQNRRDLERVQKTAIKIILNNQQNSYKKSLTKL